MKKLIKTKKGQVLWSLLITTMTWTMVFSVYLYDQNRRKQIYDSINLLFKDNTIMEYGTTTYDPISFIKKATGNVRIISTKVDLNQVGKGEITYEVEKENITKQFTVDVEIKDTQLPEIKIKKEEISLYVGDSYDVKENIESVTDPVDGDIPYLEQISDDTTNGYSILGDIDYNKAGEYPLTVKAIDKNGGMTESTFKIKIQEKPVKKQSILANVTYSNNAPRVDTNKIKELATSFLGYPYVSGGASPSGFDCSGFVYYIYGQVGLTIPKGSSGQAFYGQNIERSNLMVGDILIWSSDGVNATHTAIYVGDGNMIHAANPRKGVILTNINAWPQQLLGIKRP